MPVKRSNISWCDFSGGDCNVVIRGNIKGECECSPECDNCYALTILQKFGYGNPETTFYPEKLERLKTANFAEKDNPFRRGKGSRPIAFLADMGDLFHDRISIKQIEQSFDVMKHRKDVDWIVLTKRAKWLYDFSRVYNISDNVWCGVTVGCNQSSFRLDYLRGTRCKIKLVSIEPMLEWFNIKPWLYMLDLVFVGGESGNNRRQFDMSWAKILQGQCKQTNTAFHFKQGSHRYPGRDDLLDGVEYKEFPK